MQLAQTKHITAAAILLAFISTAVALNIPSVTSTRSPDFGLGVRKNETNTQGRGSGVPSFATFGDDGSNGSSNRNIDETESRPSEHDKNTTFGSGRNISSDTQSSQGRRVNGTGVNKQPTGRNVTQGFGEGDGTVGRELPSTDSVHRDGGNRTDSRGGSGSGSRGVSFGRDDTEHRGLASGPGQTTNTGGHGILDTPGGHQGRPDTQGTSFGGSGSEHPPLFGSSDRPSNGRDQSQGTVGHGQPGTLGGHERRPGLQGGDGEGHDPVDHAISGSHVPTRDHRPSSVGGRRDQTAGTKDPEVPGGSEHPEGHRGVVDRPGTVGQGVIPGINRGSGTPGEHDVPGTLFGSNANGNRTTFPGILENGNHGTHGGRFGNPGSIGNDSLGVHGDSGTFGEHSPHGQGGQGFGGTVSGFGSGSRNGNHGSKGQRGIGSRNHGSRGHTPGGRDSNTTGEERSSPGGFGGSGGLENSFSRPLGGGRNGTAAGQEDPVLGTGPRRNSTDIGGRNQQPTQSSFGSVNSTVGSDTSDGHSSGTNGHGLVGQPGGLRGSGVRQGQEHANQRHRQGSNTLSTGKPGGLTSASSTVHSTRGLERLDSGH
ncbi:hornerin-like [Ornithodoros turicata]|uniref:hornerin-like n=1 Tax=Ornithodoros turicata TaxID=34597 RepID=UPI003139BAD2